MSPIIENTDRLQLFDELIQLATGRSRTTRLERVLRTPDPVDNDGWAFYLPSCYNSALDIQIETKYKPPPCCFSWETYPAKNTCKKSCKKMVWTQGANFSFGRGDMIYDTPAGYKDWNIAMKEIHTVLQISRASAAAPATNDQPRFPGRVEFRILRPDKNRASLDEDQSLVLTQDEFVRYLITGDL